MLKHVVISVVCILIFVTSAFSHEVQPAIIDLDFDERGGFSLNITLNLEAILARIEPEAGDTSQSANAPEYERLRLLSPEDLNIVFNRFSEEFLSRLEIKADNQPLLADVEKLTIPPVGDLDFSRESILTLGGLLPAGASTFTWGWARDYGSSVIRITQNTENTENQTYSAYLLEGQDSGPLPITEVPERSLIQTIISYVIIGYTHIIPKGLDHILFVVGLFLLSTRLHPLLWQITAFTVAHTITLALGVTKIVTISPAIVEPLIALSIVYVCVENLFTQNLTRWRPFVVFGFGLLHGLGFAGVLMEIGLEPDQFIVGLISFNVGVEMGQISVIAVCFLCVGLWFSKTAWYRSFIVIPGSIAIGILAGWWFIERAFLA